MKRSAPPLKRVAIPQLDTIRVLAMLAIFFHHLWKTVIPTPQDALERILNPLFSAASDGVVLFNIISGFLLALPHLGPAHRPFAGYRYFMQKRFLRIIPPYYLALLFFTLANIVHFDYPLRPAFEMLLQHLLFVNSLDYSNMYSNFSHFWYLGQLAQFYLLFPVILGLFIRLGPIRASLSIIALCWGGWLLYAWCFPAPPHALPDFAENLMHFNLPGRLPEFAIGMWLASLPNPGANGVTTSSFQNPFCYLFCRHGPLYCRGSAFRCGYESAVHPHLPRRPQPGIIPLSAHLGSRGANGRIHPGEELRRALLHPLHRPLSSFQLPRGDALKGNPHT